MEGRRGRPLPSPYHPVRLPTTHAVGTGPVQGPSAVATTARQRRATGPPRPARETPRKKVCRAKRRRPVLFPLVGRAQERGRWDPVNDTVSVPAQPQGDKPPPHPPQGPLRGAYQGSLPRPTRRPVHRLRPRGLLLLDQASPELQEVLHVPAQGQRGGHHRVRDVRAADGALREPLDYGQTHPIRHRNPSRPRPQAPPLRRRPPPPRPTERH